MEPNEPQEEQEEEQGAGRSSAAIGAAMAVLLVGMAISIGVYLTREPPAPDAEGLDMAAAPAPDPEPVAVAPVAVQAPPPPKTFGIASPPPVRPAAPPTADAKGHAAIGLAEAARRHESWFRNFTIKYQTKHPIVYEWGKEWVTYPELRKARDDYWQERNPVKFAFQVASSPNLAKMIGKYSQNPAMRGYVTDLAANAPGDVLKSFTNYLTKDSTAIRLLERFVRAAGLPPALASSFTGKKVDEKEVMNQILQQNPALQGLPPVQPQR
ncbi:MAG: hypothetical protein HY553_11080 [Elusimicrobia bacterium]|nr:hypothetical protein [Elusimicrobiota bacterium]